MKLDRDQRKERGIAPQRVNFGGRRRQADAVKERGPLSREEFIEWAKTSNDAPQAARSHIFQLYQRLCASLTDPERLELSLAREGLILARKSPQARARWLRAIQAIHDRLYGAGE